MHIPIFSAILLIVIGFGCRKNNCNCDNSYKKIPENVKEWFWFGEGSQWVYQLEEDTAVRDTVTLVFKWDGTSNKFCDSDVAGAQGCSEILTVTLQHSNAKYYPNFGSDSSIGANELIRCFTSHGGGELIEYEYMGGVVIGFPLKVNDYYGRYTLKDSYQAYKLNSFIYNDVFHSSETDVSGNIIGNEVWQTKGIGLIKIKRIKPIQNWELVYYKIL